MVASATNASSVVALLGPSGRSSPLSSPQSDTALRLTESNSTADACLKGLAHVESLQLAGSELTDAGLMRLAAALPRLQWLGLAGTRITDAGLASLRRLHLLETLVLSGTGVTDEGLKRLAQIPTLRTVYLVDTRVTFAGVQALRRALPDLMVR